MPGNGFEPLDFFAQKKILKLCQRLAATFI